MTLKTLEQRFTERSKEIYNRFAPSRDQLVSVKPDTRGVFGSRSRVKDDSRSVPTVSFVRDTRRITNFLKSPEGRLYIGKQVLLQTGNTFRETRIYNPLSNIQIPNQLLIKRNIGNDTTNRGLLQSSTVLSFSGQKQSEPPTISTSMLLTPAITNANLIINRPEYNAYFANKLSYSPFLQTQPTKDERTQKKSTYLVANGTLDVNNRAFSYGKHLQSMLLGTDNTIAPDNGTIRTGLNGNGRLDEKRGNFLRKFTDGGIRSDFYFNPTGLSATLNKDTYLYEGAVFPNQEISVNSKTGTGVGTYDQLNTTDDTVKRTPSDIAFGRLNYAKLVPSEGIRTATNPDIINFAFQTNSPDSPLVKFRAFISAFKQSVKPDFQEQKYIGRTERFVSYSGAKRSASLSFNVVAFSKVELDNVWTKINYLTGLAFPLGVSTSGFMIPPLFKISIGGIYDTQPCYIETMDFEFIDDKIVFDVDNEVSQYINVNMSIVLLEKRSRFYNSPFYAITEDSVKV